MKHLLCKLSLCGLLLLPFITIQAGYRLHINNQAGTLRDSLPEALFYEGGFPIGEVTSFVVTGGFNATDFNYLKEDGRYFSALDTLDLGNAEFEPTVINGVTYPKNMIAPGAFDGFRTLNTLFLPNTITRLGEKCFAACSAMRTMPNSIDSIDDIVFAWARNLGDVITSSNLKVVGNGVWQYCDNDTGEKGLVSIVFPSLVLEKFGSTVFENCDMLESVTILKPIPPVVNGSFGNNLGKKKGKKPILYVPQASVNAYKAVQAYNTAFDIQPLNP